MAGADLHAESYSDRVMSLMNSSGLLEGLDFGPFLQGATSATAASDFCWCWIECAELLVLVVIWSLFLMVWADVDDGQWAVILSLMLSFMLPLKQENEIDIWASVANQPIGTDFKSAYGQPANEIGQFEIGIRNQQMGLAANQLICTTSKSPYGQLKSATVRRCLSLHPSAAANPNKQTKIRNLPPLPITTTSLI
ncbi:hypothetical protein Nepgr_003967 [Nepenthes gracilis]|uniref:Uncharacterized protein n=1 Tax=Nepenthes gracilis TaxID=150966 RepID=A0AAD3XEG6_NEPGR|nr:hypothetical protein Nepgr_003967 [Nepenthes gracilis]